MRGRCGLLDLPAGHVIAPAWGHLVEHSVERVGVGVSLEQRVFPAAVVEALRALAGDGLEVVEDLLASSVVCREGHSVHAPNPKTQECYRVSDLRRHLV